MLLAVLIAQLWALWAWLLPVAGPVLGVLSRVGLHLRGLVPRGTGVLAVAAIAVVGWLAVSRVSAWLDPPPRTFTAAEIEAATARAEADNLRQSLVAGLAALRERERRLEDMAARNNYLENEMEEIRAKAPGRADVVLRADDPWLREWQRRGR